MENGIQELPMRFLFKGQLQHLLLLTCLVPGAVYLASPALDGSLWLGISDQTWFYASMVLAILHQIVGWFAFRFQLVFSLFSRLFGKYDMVAWGLLFFPLMLLRPILTVGLGLSDYGSLESFRIIQLITATLLLMPVIYTFWSIKKYFGVSRALGGDHFRQQYREMHLVNEGAFKYSSNAMYTFAFMLFWSIALFTGSEAALASALFQHAYIWVHMYCTENPDMDIIYPKSNR
jgi:Phospholipid methyltransferase